MHPVDQSGRRITFSCTNRAALGERNRTGFVLLRITAGGGKKRELAWWNEWCN